MNKLITQILFLLLLAFVATTEAFPQKTLPNSPGREYQQKTVEKYSNDKDFQYKQIIKQEPVSFWDKLQMWFWDKFWSLFSNQGAAPYIRLVIVVLLLAGLIFLILKTRFNLAWFANKAKKDDVLMDGDIENVQSSQLERDIEQEIKLKNYRNAIRLMFILVLKLLHEQKIIKWQREKTNFHYQNEISAADYKQFFKQLSYIFEYVWYGRFEPTDQHFNKYLSIYEQLKQRLNAKS